MSYPECLIRQLAVYGQKPTGNIEYDRAVLLTLSKRSKEAEYGNRIRLESKIKQCGQQSINELLKYPNLADPEVAKYHGRLFMTIANEIVLFPQRRKFVIDEHNVKVIRFLLYYFNNCSLAETIFPERGYKLHKHIMLKGGVGVGKSILMQCFSEYLKHIRSPRYFYNASVTEMVNYYMVNNTISKFTFNDSATSGRPDPFNICLNDIGLDDDKVFYGMNTSVLTDEFLYARNDIWQSYDKFAHVTTNLDEKQLIARFNTKDSHGRIVDRFKTYNVIELTGPSRR